MGAHAAPSKRSKLLPENAYRKLTPGEEYRPIVGPEDRRAEVTPWSIGMGLIMTVIFAAACVYIALRAGSGIEASIPIAILAIFFGKLKKIRSTILENVMVQSVGQAAGVVAAGAAFLVPALYINHLTPEWWQIFLACFIGGTLGVVLIVPLRKFFVKDMHGDLPFPEATAVNEILCSGESSGPTAGKVLIVSFLLGAVFDFLIEFFHFWPGKISSTMLLGSLGQDMSAAGFEVSVYGIAALFGLGYIIGIKYASIIAAGSVLAVLVIVPAIVLIGRHAGDFEYAGAVYNIGSMDPAGVFGSFLRPIGIGAIAVSGIIGILRMSKIVGSSVSLGFKGFKKGVQATADPRTQLDMNPKNVLVIQGAMMVLMGVLFFIVAMTTVDSATNQTYTVGASLLYAVVGAFVGFLLSFLFTPVAAQAIAIVGVNPVSGMTLITVVFTILVLVAFGLSGTGGMFVALIVGTAVCTALSTSGALISDFKIGYWIGATPRQQQRWKFLGIAVAALVVAFVIPVMDSSYHFLVEDPNVPGKMISNTAQLPAPQANMIAAVAKGLLEDAANQPWLLYGLGALSAFVLFMAGIPMLAFALGMYLPIGINMAVLLGAITAWIVGKTGGSERARKARSEQGILIASGMMAGAAILGILSATTRIPDIGAPIRHASVGVKIFLIPEEVKTALQRDASERKASVEFLAAHKRELEAWEVSEAFVEYVADVHRKGQIRQELLVTAVKDAAKKDAWLSNRAARKFLRAWDKLGFHRPTASMMQEVQAYKSFFEGIQAELEKHVPEEFLGIRLPHTFPARMRAEVARRQTFEDFLESVRSGVGKGKVSSSLAGEVEHMARQGMVSQAFLSAVQGEAKRAQAYEEVVRAVKVAAESGNLPGVLELLKEKAEAKVVTKDLVETLERRAYVDSLPEVAGDWTDADVISELGKQVALKRVSEEVARAVETFGLHPQIKEAASNRNLFRTLETLTTLLARFQAPDDLPPEMRLDPVAREKQRIEILAGVAEVAKEGPAVSLDETPREWFYGRAGNTLALAMLVLLGFSCFLLARWGAKGTIAEEDQAEKETPVA